MTDRLRAFFYGEGPKEPEEIPKLAAADITGDLERDFRNLEGCYMYLQRKVRDMDEEITRLEDKQHNAILGLTVLILATLGVTLLSLLHISGII